MDPTGGVQSVSNDVKVPSAALNIPSISKLDRAVHAENSGKWFSSLSRHIGDERVGGKALEIVTSKDVCASIP